MNNLITNIKDVNILICATFHFNHERLKYLKKILSEHRNFGKNVKVYLFTNTNIKSEIELIKNSYPRYLNTEYQGDYSIELIICDKLLHPHNLILEHKKILKKDFINSKYYTHFLHTEDDNLISAENINYWLKYRKILYYKNIIPSFFRFEFSNVNELKSTDIGFKIINYFAPKILINDLIFINMPNPSQSNYLIDKKLAKEMINNPNDRKHHFYFNFGGIRENADIGPIFSNVPKNYISRNFVPFQIKNNNLLILKECLINHIPANYLSNQNSNLGKIPINSLFLKFPFLSLDLLRNIKYYPLVQMINFLIKIFK